LDLAFILPFPDSKRAPGTEELSMDQKETPEFRLLLLALERLRSQKMTWDEFFQVVDPADPALRTVTTKEGDNILHLAVMSDLTELALEIADDRGLLLKRNHYGLTPIEISQFLKKGRFSKHLPSHAPIPFRKMPGVLIEDTHDHAALDQLSFLPNPVFERDQTLYNILSRSQKAKLKDQIPPEKIWMGIYFDKEVQQGVHPPVSIRFIDEEVGFGVFAEQRISSCSFVGEYTGIIQERKRKQVKDKRYCVRYTVWEMGRRNFIIDAEKMGNFTRFINHSSKPNLSLQSVYWRGMPRMIFIALKEIEEGTQFTFDYGTFFWKECQQTPKHF
jgi:hypothetical protein